MDRGIKIIKEIYDTMGFEIDDMVKNYRELSYVNEYEGQVIIDPRFKKLVEIISTNYMVPYRDAIKVSDVKLVGKNPEINMTLTNVALEYGRPPYIVRADLLLFNLRCYSIANGLKPSDILRNIYYKDKYYKVEKSLIKKLKYHLKKSEFEDNVIVQISDLLFISLVTGKPKSDIIDMIYAKYKLDKHIG